MNLIKYIVRAYLYIQISGLWSSAITLPTLIFSALIMGYYQLNVNELYFTGSNTWTSLYQYEIVMFIYLTIFIAIILSFYIMTRKWHKRFMNKMFEKLRLTIE